MQARTNQMRSEFKISAIDEHGLTLTVSDIELADSLDDYLTEKCYVFYSQRLGSNCVEFFFGQLGSEEKLIQLLERFEATK